MKRIHLFEFEDQRWFPDWIRRCMTRLILVVHRIIGSEDDLADLLGKTLRATGHQRIIDLCSGSGGPMPGLVQRLRQEDGLKDVTATLTDLYPNRQAAEDLNGASGPVKYRMTSTNATQLGAEEPGLRTMICSFHHMPPEVAKGILASAQQSKQPFCLFEISDNSTPKALWWVAIPINILTCLLITPFVRPLTWQQLVFTYLIPIIPVFFAWDGAASNPRTYTLADLDVLLSDLPQDGYTWKKGIIKNRGKKLYLIGEPLAV